MDDYPLSFGGVTTVVYKSFENYLPLSVEKSGVKPKRGSQQFSTSTSKNNRLQECISSIRSEPIIGFGRNKKTQTSKRGDNAVLYVDSVENLTSKIDAFLESSSTTKKLSRSQSKAVTNIKRDLRSEHKYDDFISDGKSTRIFSIEVFIHWYNENPNHYKQKLDIIFSDFSIPKKNHVGENDRLSYAYLLLDSRKFSDSCGIDWTDFIESVFYIGKGKNKRAFNHTQEAEKNWQSGDHSAKAKIRRIHDIWSTKKPVMILTIFENVVNEDEFIKF